MKLLLLSITILLGLSSSSCNRPVSQSGNTGDTSAVPSAVVSYRPLFHFAPKQNWINDPNGLVFYKGNYHLFYQYNPLGDLWGHMSWGHTISTDLMNWKEQAVALYEDKNNDGSVTMIFSGTAVVDSANTSALGAAGEMPLVAIYTSHVTKGGSDLAQHQSMAYSSDGLSFSKYSKNPILDIGSKEFRDPKVFWHDATKKWIMIVAKPDEKKIRLFNSPDLKSWTYLSDFGNIGNTAKIWECPDLFELPVTNAVGEKKWVLTVSAGHPHDGYLAMQYFIGSFDGTTFKADPLNYPLYMDEGKDFYAGIIYNNLPPTDSRKIMISWANSWEYAREIPTTGFRGMMAIPRSLSLVKKDNTYHLIQLPVAEVDKYRGESKFNKDVLTVSNQASATGINSDAMDIQFSITRGEFQQAGIKILKNGPEETTIYFDKAANKIKLDRSRSGKMNFSNRFPGPVDEVSVPGGNQDIKVRILVDKSLVEVFVNDGEKVITDQVFPNAPGGAVEFYSTGGSATFRDIKIWQMKPSVNQD